MLFEYFWNSPGCIESFAMELTEEEKTWLVNIAAEIPDGKLTPMEEHWYKLAKPKTAMEAMIFQLLACLRFGLNDQVISILDKSVHTVEQDMKEE